MPKLITGVGCPYCGSSCDDLEVLVSDDETKVLEVHNSCIIGSNLFHHANDPTRPRLPRKRQPDGSMKEIPYDEAIDWMAKTMLAAKKPLIYGFGSTNCEGMSAVGRIAEKAGADVLVDDRAERPGVKFKDADLIGVPVRVVAGKKLAAGNVELIDRKTKKSQDVHVTAVAAAVKTALGEAAK